MDEQEPLKLADGTLVYPDGRVEKERSSFVEVPTRSEAVRQVMKVKKTLLDLPVPPKNANGVGLVVFYRMWGLGNSDIAIALGVTEQQVVAISTSPAYEALYNDVMKRMMERDGEEIAAKIAAYSHEALEKVVEVVRTSDSEKYALIAAKDLLDRGGHRPVDLVLHKHEVDGVLKIEYVQPQSAAPTIEVQVVGE